MSRLTALLSSAFFLFAEPGVVAGLVPWLICQWHVEPAFFGLSFVRALGVFCFVVGLAALLESFGRFALEGIGTPAPIIPTRHLVVKALYRYVRNPMYLAVECLILGQALLFGNVSLLIYGALFWPIFHLFVVSYEEPTLRKTFGAEYDAFCADVPRWLPRLTKRSPLT